jgi:hypothetical protein
MTASEVENMFDVTGVLLEGPDIYGDYAVRCDQGDYILYGSDNSLEDAETFEEWPPNLEC